MRRITFILAAAVLATGPAATAFAADTTPEPRPTAGALGASHGKAAKLTVTATITAVPGTVTKAEEAARGAFFIIYKLPATATALPATQPTKGGEVRKLERGTLAAGTLTGTLKFESVKGKVRVYAIYPSGVNTTPVLVKIAADGTLTASAPVTTAYSALPKASDAKKVGEKKK